MADGKQTISFRIRKIDSDLSEAVAKLGKDEIADLARNGMRLMLGIGTTRTAQVIERPIRPLNAATYQQTSAQTTQQVQQIGSTWKKQSNHKP